MKKSLVKWRLVVVLLLLVAACGKEESTQENSSQYFIKCKIDGVDKTFNVNAVAQKENLGDSSTGYSIFGKATKDASSIENLGFGIQIYIPFKTGTYKETPPTTDFYVGGVYNPNTTSSTGIYRNNAYDDSDPFQITFTGVSATELSGTFKGKLYLNNDSIPYSDSVIISNGSFKVKMQ